MSPLLGAIGDASEYAYRGTLDDVPEDFNFTNINDAEPGIAYTTGPITITGLNNKVQVTVSAGASIAVNSGIFTSGPTFIRSGDTIALYTPTTQGTDNDFSKTYTITANVGQTSKDWLVITRAKDSSPVSFSFVNSTNQELGITSTSNTITLSGLEPTVSSIAAITSGIGSFTKNGGSPGTASTVGNGDTIAIVLEGPTDYSKTNTTTLSVGDFSADYSVSTRDADTTVDQFSFTNFTNVAISSSFDSNSITLSGADTNTVDAPVPLTATVTGGFLKVDRGAIPIRDFSVEPATVFNGDTLTLKLNSSINYSETTSATLSITGVNTPVGVASTFSVTTRPNISDTIVNNFQFVDKSDQDRGVLVISDPITISGITTGADDFASIFLSNNADGGEFRITRNGTVVRDFGISTSGVRQGDVVDLRIRTSPASEGTVLTNVNVAGTDNNDINNVFSQTRTDTWVVKSAKRNCPLSLPTFESVTGVEPGTVQSVTFIPAGYDTDCNVTVNTSNSNSTLSVGGTTGNNLVVAPGVACTVSLTAGPFNGSRSTTITLTANNNVPSVVSTASTFTVSTRASEDPTVNISVSPSSIECGDQAVLTWSTTKAVSIVTSGFSGIATQGSILVNPKQNTTYSITATGPDATTRTASASIAVQSSTDILLEADETFIDFNGSVTLFWQSINASSVVSNFGAFGTFGSRTINNLKSTQTYTIRAISNNGCSDSPTRQVIVNVAPCAEETDIDTSYGSGINLNYTVANAGQGFEFYFTSLTGSNINSPSRSAFSGPPEVKAFQSGPTISPFPAGTCGGGTFSCVTSNNDFLPTRSFTVPNGVDTVFIIASGGGGGGGGGGALVAGGNGGRGGEDRREFPVRPGDRLLYNVGSGGLGASPCEAGNIGRGGFSAGPGGSTFVWINAQNNNSIVSFAEGGGGGARDDFRSLPGADGRSFAGGRGADGGFGGSPSGQPCAGSFSQFGRQGAPGYLIIEYEISQQSSAPATWSTLINTINNQFRSSFNRPPSVAEMDFWIGSYISFEIEDINTLSSRIASSGAFRSNTGATSQCGVRL